MHPTTTTTPAPLPTVALQVTIQQVFIVALNNPQSAEFKTLAIAIITVCDVIYRTKYGNRFVRTIVIAFRPVAIRSGNTEAQIELVFNDTSTEPIPQSGDIVNTLKEAVSNPNSTFNISVDVNSITVIYTANITTVINSTVTATTTLGTTTALATVTVMFRSLRETFTTDLLDSSSSGFKNRATLIKTQLEPFYQTAFISFHHLTVTRFSNGSIINSMDVAFSSSSVPTTTAIGTVLIKAASNITAFNIDITSLTVNGTIVNSAVSINKTNLFTASCLVLLSLFMSRQLPQGCCPL